MTKRRERRDPEPGEYQDPLKNYQPPDYADGLERSLSEDLVEVIGHRPYLAVRTDTRTREALRQMAEDNIACAVVVDAEDKPVGIVSELDVVYRIALRYHELANEPVTTVMTPDPVVVYESETPSRALNAMGTGCFRHLPVCDVDGRLTGVIGARRLTEYLQRYVEGAP